MRPSSSFPTLTAQVVTTCLIGLLVAACASAPPPAVAPASATGVGRSANTPSGVVSIPSTAEVDAAWKARPDFVRTLPKDWQAAYKFALARPDVVAWMPCNCGCGGDGHRSNLDCFFVRREAGRIVFEEHGSYCDICVNTANLAARLIDEGKSLLEVRAAVDAAFGGGGHDTDTPLPPA